VIKQPCNLSANTRFSFNSRSFLFLIYINDICNIDSDYNVKLYADDTNAFVYSSGLNGVLGPLAPIQAAVSGVRSNATGSSMSVCMMRVRGARNDTLLSFEDIIFI